jgi:5-methylcytosine-specific restriction endonuclease McrA
MLSRPCDLKRRANAFARRSRVCEQCGASFIQGKLSSKQIAAGHVQRFCSRECRASSSRIHATPAEAKRVQYIRSRESKGLAVVGTCSCPQCGEQFIQSNASQLYCSKPCSLVAAEARRLEREAAAFVPRSFQCLECGVDHTTSRGSPSSVYCSQRCSDRSHHRIGKQKRRARLAGATTEAVNPTEVFDRDGWRCHLCGCSTPRRLRGSINARAPELDHIIPLAKGGEHSYRNVACCCRACNGEKGDKIKGQQLLFG